MANEKNKTFLLKITKSMCRKVYPVLKPGDNIEVSFNAKFGKGDLVLVSHNDKQWIERYSKNLDKYNIYPVVKVFMNS